MVFQRGRHHRPDEEPVGNDQQQHHGLRLTLDGKPLAVNLKRDFRVQSAVYPAIVPDKNLYQAFGEPQIKAGNYLGADDAIYVMLKPLTKGAHTMNFKGSFTNPFVFDLDFTHELDVK